MKSFAAISAIFLAAASTAAAQTSGLKLVPLTVKHLSNTKKTSINFTVQDLNGAAYTTCQHEWNLEEVIDSNKQWACTDPNFTFSFPEPITDVESFNFIVSHNAVDYQAILNSHAGTPVYVCKTLAVQIGTETTCRIPQGSDIIAQDI
ncbi:hypothetical protein BJY04DRAFT_213212 [Aspergillus karnatakaensis]|uniref:uncharacterized protein n=1 Tax=Aspergillus karnatakaensis TaxID=1810916 RepID=UPI003CCE4E3E